MLLKDLYKHTAEVRTPVTITVPVTHRPDLVLCPMQDHPDYTTLKEALNFIQKVCSCQASGVGM